MNRLQVEVNIKDTKYNLENATTVKSFSKIISDLQICEIPAPNYTFSINNCIYFAAFFCQIFFNIYVKLSYKPGFPPMDLIKQIICK